VTEFRPGGRIDGRYEIVERLGSGAMGVVYRGKDIFLDRAVALKLVDPQMALGAAADEFVKEARALAQIRHANVVQVYAYGIHDHTPFFAMEFVDGVNLDDVIEKHAEEGTRMDQGRALEIIAAVGRGLDAVHAQKLVHRDVKPSNVMLENGTGRPVLVDFGLARKKSSSSPTMSLTGGTPQYLSPEQARDPDGTLTTRASDLYSLACSAYEMLTGSPVFMGDVYAVMRAHADDAPALPSSIDEELAVFDRVFARALAKTPEYRHESCAEFVAELDAAAAILRGPMSRRRFSKPPRSHRPDALRCYLYEPDEALARRITSVADRALSTPNLGVFTAASDLVTAFEQLPADVIVIDDEHSASPTMTVVNAIRKLRGGEAVEMIVLSRNYGSSALAALGVRELPKPVSMQVLESVLGKVATRIAERRIPR
jgi:eukaryotic-like serine/threonine-protein kinase